ncbi:hypothetical protein ACQ5SK_45190 [Bradyrhizobium japonicum]
MNVAAEIPVHGVDTVELRARHVQRGDVARLEACCERGEFEIVQGVGHRLGVSVLVIAMGARSRRIRHQYN